VLLGTAVIVRLGLFFNSRLSDLLDYFQENLRDKPLSDNGAAEYFFLWYRLFYIAICVSKKNGARA
jgi:hypothetical protein